ncbi:unnamed protein product [Chrysoparadoxa australica]
MGRIPQFLGKLKSLLTPENTDIIQWVEGQIHVKNPMRLENEILHKVFRHRNYSSFQRQLNYFDFRKIEGKGKESAGVYSNQALQGKPLEAILQIRRKTNGGGTRASTGGVNGSSAAGKSKAARAKTEMTKKRKRDPDEEDPDYTLLWDRPATTHCIGGYNGTTRVTAAIPANSGRERQAKRQAKAQLAGYATAGADPVSSEQVHSSAPASSCLMAMKNTAIPPTRATAPAQIQPSGLSAQLEENFTTYASMLWGSAASTPSKVPAAGPTMIHGPRDSVTVTARDPKLEGTRRVDHGIDQGIKQAIGVDVIRGDLLINSVIAEDQDTGPETDSSISSAATELLEGFGDFIFTDGGFL